MNQQCMVFNKHDLTKAWGIVYEDGQCIEYGWVAK